jgi:hypothetical protein
MAETEKRCMLTVATYRHLPMAFVLVESFADNNPGCDIVIFVPDLSRERIETVKWPLPSSVKILGLDDIADPLIQKMHQYFDAFEFCCAAKSFLLEYALFMCGYNKAIFLDSDIACYSSFDRVWSILDEGKMIVTPHTNSPMPEDDFKPDDREYTCAGFINGGFWAAVRNNSTRKILSWIKEKVNHFGFFLPEINLYADQTWMSCLPWFFPDNTIVVRDRGLNVAYWNLHERQLRQEDGVVLSDGEKLGFFHFSGYEINNQNRLTIHTLREYTGDNNLILRKLVEDYRMKIDKAITSLPQLEPDVPCCSLPLNKRVKKYEVLEGRKPKFFSELQKLSILGRAKGLVDGLFSKFTNL